MLRALLVAALMLLISEPAEACSMPECAERLILHSPQPDAGEVPTNVQLIAVVPFSAIDPQYIHLQPVDGTNTDGGVALEVVTLSSFECSRTARIRPLQPLLPDTVYRLYVTPPPVELPGPGFTRELPTLFFRTGAGTDDTPPFAPTLQERKYFESSCSSCGTSGGGASVSFDKGDAVWFAPIEAKFRSSGGLVGFAVPFACNGVSPGLAEGVHQMPVIAFDSAWNQSEISYVELETNCSGVDPCTGERLSQNDSAAPLRGASGCGCSSSPTLLSLLSAAGFIRVLSRRRGWSSSSTSGCWRWGRSASSSSRSRR